MKKINVLSLCDGIATGKLAFEALRIPHDYYAVELNQPPRDMADANTTGIIRYKNDVTKLTHDDIFTHLPVFDYFLCGFTCKSLSVQGNRKNLEGSSGIAFDVAKLLWMCKYRNPDLKFLIENVKSMEDDMKEFLDDLFGVENVNINSALVSGQARERLYWCNWDVEQPNDMGILANNELEDDASELKAWSKSSRYKDDKTGRVYSSPAPGRTLFYEDRFRKDGKANTLVTGKGFKGQSTKNIVVTRTGEERDLTVREGARLQTLPDSFSFDMVSDNQACDAIGNGWNFRTILHLIKESIKDGP